MPVEVGRLAEDQGVEGVEGVQEDREDQAQSSIRMADFRLLRRCC